MCGKHVNVAIFLNIILNVGIFMPSALEICFIGIGSKISLKKIKEGGIFMKL